MYSNVLFKFNAPFEVISDEMFASILLANGETYKVKVVASSELGLRGVTKEVLDKDDYLPVCTQCLVTARVMM